MRSNAPATKSIGSALSNVSTSLPQNRWKALTPDERHKILLENLSEVRHVAREIHVRLPLHSPFEDLVHEGVVGLIDAVEKYDATKNVQFRWYARFRIRGAILDSLRQLDWGPRFLRRHARRIEQANRGLASKLGRMPSEPEVAAELGIPLKKLHGILNELYRLKMEISHTLPELSSKQEVYGVRSNCPGEDPFDECVRTEAKRALIEAIETLAKQERQALTLYYFEERTMKEVGQVLNVRESRVSQIIAAALARLRACLPKN